VASLRRIAPLLFGLPAALLVVFGVLMVLDSPAWDFGQRWIQIAFVLLVAAAAAGAVFARRAMEAAGRALEVGDPSGASRYVAQWSRVIGLILVLLVLATCDMILKPGL
jgi:drug/metabolite transporter (DMT)-like permease